MVELVDVVGVMRLAPQLIGRWLNDLISLSGGLMGFSFTDVLDCLGKEGREVRERSGSDVLVGLCRPFRIALGRQTRLLVVIQLKVTVSDERVHKERLVHELRSGDLLHVGRLVSDQCRVAINESTEHAVVIGLRLWERDGRFDEFV